jgi:DnaJ-class molecular chaperone
MSPTVKIWFVMDKAKEYYYTNIKKIYAEDEEKWKKEREKNPCLKCKGSGYVPYKDGVTKCSDCKGRGINKLIKA